MNTLINDCDCDCKNIGYINNDWLCLECGEKSRTISRGGKQ
jgi:hypothetical protein